MRSPNGRRSARTYVKIIAIFLVVFLSLFCIGAGALRWSNRELSRNILSALRAQQHSFLDRTGQDIGRVYRLLLDMTQDNDLTRLAKTPESWLDYERTAAVGRICQRLTSIQNSNAAVRSVRAYLPNFSWSLHSDGTPGGSYSDITGKQVTALDAIPTNGSPQLAWSEGRLLIPFSVRNPWEPERPFFILTAEFSADRFQKDYEASGGYGGAPYRLGLAPDFFFGDFEPGMDSSSFFQAARESLIRNPEESISWNHAKYLGVYVEEPQSGMSVLQLLNQEEALRPLRPLRLLTVVFFVLALVFLLIYCLSAYFLINKPIRELTSAFRRLETGDFSIALPITGQNDFSFLYRGFNHMVKTLDNLVNEVYEQKLLIQKSELKQLQSQINPHFLYNSYFLLHRLIRGGDLEKATLFSKNMGVYFQFITRSAADVVPLSGEYRHAQIYADIQAMRFEKRIFVRMDPLPKELEDLPAPRLILQPVIENAFEHSLENKQEDGRLEIHIHTDGPAVQIIVEDNGDETDDDTILDLRRRIAKYQPGQETSALININRRLRLFFGESSGVTVRRSALGGLAVELNMERKGEGGDVSAVVGG